MDRRVQQPVPLNPNDELRVRCVFDTTDREEVTVWGDKTSDEMCLATLYTYDNGPLPDPPPPAMEDPSCPHYVGEAQGMPIDLPGCCTAEGRCGVISSVNDACITESRFLSDLAPGPDCDATGDRDAGMADGG
ncbi:MAG: hypothetical protein OXU20_40885 [Myxococcales bacterium]|nr:hypothetical protein [Myxococcales bacterium]